MSLSPKQFDKLLESNPGVKIIRDDPIGESFAAATGQTKKVNGPQKTLRHSILFDSLAEANRHDVLLLQQRAGLILDLETKPKYVLQAAYKKLNKTVRARTWEADWSYTLANGVKVVEDYKGYMYRSFRDKVPYIQKAIGSAYLFINDDVDALCECPAITE